MVESHWVKPAPVPLINRSVGWFSPIFPHPFKYRFVFKGLLQKKDAVGEHLIDISRLGMYYHSCILANSQLFRDDYICGLLVLLLILSLSFPHFFSFCPFHCPSAFPLKCCKNQIC